ncbi:unnamed protein product, partial [Rotaria sp. Silwood1]
VNAYDHNHS